MDSHGGGAQESIAVRIRRIAEAGIGLLLFAGLIGVPSETSAGERRVQHLVRAAAHLEQAGMAELASEVRQQLQDECPAVRKRLLEQKQTELEQLQAEMAQLHQAGGDSHLWSVQVRLFQVDWQRVEAMGLILASLRCFDTPLPDETGQLVALLESLERQGLIRVLAEPVLQVTPERTAKYDRGPHSSHGERLAPPSTSERDWGTRILGHPRHAGDQRIELDLEIRHAGLVPGPATEAAEGEPRRPEMLEWQMETRIELQCGQPVLLGGLQVQSKSDASWGLIAVLQATRAN